MQKIKFKLKQGQKVQTDRKTSRQIRTQKAEKKHTNKKTGNGKQAIRKAATQRHKKRHFFYVEAQCNKKIL